MGIFYFVLGIVLFIGLILIHEWGHFKLAKRNGVDVEEFGLFFPPRAKILTKKDGTIYTLNWLPLGGFVKLKGEHDQDTEKGSFGAASSWIKTKILMAGVAMNLLTALVIFTIVALIGMPKLIDGQTTVKSDERIIATPINEDVVKIGVVTDDSPALRSGLQEDDEIISIAGTEINTPEEVSEATESNAGRTVEIVIQRGDEKTVQSITLNETSPYLGVGPYSAREGFKIARYTWSAPIVAIGVTKDFTVATMKGLGTALAGLGKTIVGFVTGNSDARQSGQTEASSQVSGPVGIFATLYYITEYGIGMVLFLIGLISLALAIMNALPIPALDGGRLFVMLLFRGLKKPLRPSLEEKIHGTGFAALMLLFVLITIVDIRRFF